MKRPLTLALLLTGLCIVLALATMSLSGCSAVASALDLENPRYSIRDIRPRLDLSIPLSASSIDFEFYLGVDNPNRIAIRLDRVDFDLSVDQSRLLTATSQAEVHIPARGYGEVPLRARVGYAEIRNVWETVVDRIRGNRARYELNGTAYYDTPVGTVRFPVRVVGTR